MRTNLIIIACLALAGLGLGFLFNSAPATAPSFSFETLDGKTHNLTDFQDKIVILNFWASWCPPCVQEFPKLVNIAKEHGDDVVFIALSSDIDDQTIQHFLHQQTFAPAPNILVARDRSNITGEIFHTSQLPETFILDHTLKIRAKFIGANWQTDELESRLGILEKSK